MIRRWLSAAVIAIWLAGCAPTPGPGTLLVDIGGDWRLERGTIEGAAIPIVRGSDITIGIQAPSIVGTSACNSWGGRIALVDGAIRVTDIASTAMVCGDEIMASESAFMRAIALVDAAELGGGRLIMRGPGVELEFGPG